MIRLVFVVPIVSDIIFSDLGREILDITLTGAKSVFMILSYVFFIFTSTNNSILMNVKLNEEKKTRSLFI